MIKNRMALRSGLLFIAAIFVGSLLAGCPAKDDKPTAPGFYDGPMAKKGAPKVPSSDGKSGNP
ncbi:MAG: hypothetical protein ABJA67_02855 [Chthonomonadales bacterium]